MKVIPFSVPKIKKEAFRLQVDSLPYLYDKLHQHEEAQIMLIEKGEGTLIVADYVGRFSPGDLYFINGNQPHVFRSDDKYYRKKSKKNVVATSLYFNLSMEEFWSFHELQGVAQMFTQAGVGFAVKKPVREECNHLIQQLKNAEGISRLLLFLRLLGEFMNSACRKRLSIAPSHFPQARHDNKRMNDVLAYTFKNSKKKITIGDVANVANLGEEAFCRYFKTHTRKTYTTFLNEVRVSNACKMLIEGDWDIQTIAYDCGFQNQSHFNRTFKKVTGKTPRSYL